MRLSIRYKIILPFAVLLVFAGVIGTGVATAQLTNTAARSEEHTSELQSRLHLVCRLLLENKEDYYRRCREVFIKPPEMPLKYNTPWKWGCTYDCGLRTDHEHHSCLSMITICDYCNLRCPI